jgi:hypothetical protein
MPHESEMAACYDIVYSSRQDKSGHEHCSQIVLHIKHRWSRQERFMVVNILYIVALLSVHILLSVRAFSSIV